MPEATLQRLSPLTTVATVTLVLGFRGSKPTRRTVHELPSRAAIASTLGVAGTLRGDMQLAFFGADAYAQARAALDSLAGGGVHRLNRPGAAAVHLVPFVVDGDPTITLDDGRTGWIVGAHWIEVPA